MQARQTISTNQYILAGLFVAAALTAVIGFTAANLSGFQIIGNTEIAFAYPWRLAEPSAAARLTAWGG